jgi:hypothetical protein
VRLKEVRCPTVAWSPESRGKNGFAFGVRTTEHEVVFKLFDKKMRTDSGDDQLPPELRKLDPRALFAKAIGAPKQKQGMYFERHEPIELPVHHIDGVHKHYFTWMDPKLAQVLRLSVRLQIQFYDEHINNAVRKLGHMGASPARAFKAMLARAAETDDTLSMKVG